MSTGLTFGGVDIDSAASNIKLVDVAVSGIKRDALARERPIAPGAFYVRTHNGARTVTVTFALLDKTASTRQTALLALNTWALSDQPKQLYVPHFSDRYLNAVCTELPDPSYRQWWESRLRIVFTAYDPYWYEASSHTVACGTAFTAGGNVPPRITIGNVFSSAASGVEYKNSDNTQVMHFSYVPAGTLLIDLDAQTAEVGGSTIMQYYTLGSSFITPVVGTQTIQGTGTVDYRARWA